MKFSVWDYSQVKIAQFNQKHPHLAIEPTDIFIFTWFKGFANKTRAKSLKKDGSKAKGMWCKTINGVDYFNVRYDAIIKDFPILGVCNVKSIQRRFDKYVEAGIFEKTIVHAGKKGNFAYFAFTDLFLSFEYDNDNPEHTEQNKTADAEQKVQSNSVGMDKNVQTKTFGTDKNVQTKTVGMDKDVHTKPLGADKNVQSLLNNSATSLNNPATSSSESPKADDTIKQEATQKTEKEVFLKTITKLFGYNPSFYPDPYPVFRQHCQESRFEAAFLEEYLAWIFDYLKQKCRNQNNFVSYFYKSFHQSVYIAQFSHNKELEMKRLLAKKNRQITCPVCGKIHDKDDFYCPNEKCQFPKEGLGNNLEIAKQKSLYELRQNDRGKYDEYQKSLNDLYKEYPMNIIIMDKTLQSEFNKKLKELENKYLNVQTTAWKS